MFFRHNAPRLPTLAEALPGRSEALAPAGPHHVNKRSLLPPYPAHLEIADFALGCFWGAERVFWQLPGVWVTAVGYQGGHTPNPTYEETCSGLTGHAEAVRVVFDPKQISYNQLLKTFWEAHDPTQGMRQGNDIGTQYRSAIYIHSEEQQLAAEASAKAYGAQLRAAGFGPITTEIRSAPPFYFAEEYHQQYLSKNPAGYCGLGSTGVTCAMPTGVEAS